MMMTSNLLKASDITNGRSEVESLENISQGIEACHLVIDPMMIIIINMINYLSGALDDDWTKRLQRRKGAMSFQPG